MSKPIPELTEDDFERFLTKVDKSNDCWLWTAYIDKNGYGTFKLKGVSYRSPRIAYFIANSVDPGKLIVCHTCDNPSCVNPDHLWLGTAVKNAKDCVQKGRRPKREQHGRAKLTEKDVREILASDEVQQILADRFDVCQSVISSIKLGKHWNH